jgi:hypothetical protein
MNLFPMAIKCPAITVNIEIYNAKNPFHYTSEKDVNICLYELF